MDNKQTTESWFSQRLGKFTASEIHKIMGNKSIGETGKSYAFSKAVEIVFGKVEENFVSFDMQRGLDLEQYAFNKFKELMMQNFIEVTPSHFFEYNENAGASPDGLVGDDAVLEIKCPKPVKLLKLIVDGKVDDDYILQMQMQMLSSNRTKAYFFNYAVVDGVVMHHTIEIGRDDDIISKMKERIAEATLIRDEYVKQLLENKQF